MTSEKYRYLVEVTLRVNQHELVSREESTDPRTDFATAYQLGVAYLNLNQFDSAIELLQTAVGLVPDDEALVAHVERLIEKPQARQHQDGVEGVTASEFGKGDKRVARLLALRRRSIQARA